MLALAAGQERRLPRGSYVFAVSVQVKTAQGAMEAQKGSGNLGSPPRSVTPAEGLLSEAGFMGRRSIRSVSIPCSVPAQLASFKNHSHFCQVVVSSASVP